MVGSLSANGQRNNPKPVKRQAFLIRSSGERILEKITKAVQNVPDSDKENPRVLVGALIKGLRNNEIENLLKKHAQNVFEEIPSILKQAFSNLDQDGFHMLVSSLQEEWEERNKPIVPRLLKKEELVLCLNERIMTWFAEKDPCTFRLGFSNDPAFEKNLSIQPEEAIYNDDTFTRLSKEERIKKLRHLTD